MSSTVHDPVARAGVLDFRGQMSLASRNRWAAMDIVEGLKLWPLARSLGWLDIRLRYRGSLLGPGWLTLSTAVMIGALGVLYSTLFQTDIHDYLPFLALSQILWTFLAGMVSEGCSCFTQAEGMILAARMPLFLHALRTLVRNVLVLAHNILVLVAVYLYFQINPGWTALLSLPGVAVWIVDMLAVCLLLGAFCARFRDVGPIIGSIMQIAFFLTPVIWQPEQLGPSQWTLPFNPFFALLEIVRAPLLGSVPSLTVWKAALFYSGILCVVSWLFFVRARGRVPFWM
jgi:lipopolysaccharide transport system permease protein